MHVSRLVYRGLTHYWRTNIAVVLGVATAVAVLAGALLVGDSVRGSLRDLVVQRLGRADQLVLSSGFFREQLTGDLIADPAFAVSVHGIVPLVVTEGVVTEQDSGRRAGKVQVYGVDNRFWTFHGVSGVTGPDDRDAFMSPPLAAELFGSSGPGVGRTILVRVQRPSDMPLESLHGRKDDLGRTLRVTVRQVVPAAQMGEFSVDPRQGDVRAVFVPLSRMQRDLEIDGLVNAALVSAVPGTDAIPALERMVRRAASLEDIGLKVRTLDARGVVEIGSDMGLLDDGRVAAVRQAISSSGARAQEVFTYLANGLRIGDRDVPYSLVTAMDLHAIAPAAVASPDKVPPIVLNRWAATELGANVGDPVAMEYYVWEDPGQLVTHSAEFRVAGIVPVDAADRDLAPVYPGISDSVSLRDWDPPFPLDLRRIRPVDEAYWEKYRTTPKAFVPLEVGQRLWRSRYGAVTSVRVAPPPGVSLLETRSQLEERLRASIDPLTMGIAIRDVRAQGLAASRGATDFGAYFVYFSFFLVVSALLLASLFFKLGIEQRVREVGLLRAVGFGPAAVRRLFTAEGLLLAIGGSALGVLGAISYAALLMLALRTWWVDAVGTTALTLHVSTSSLVAGAIGGIVAAVVCIWWTLRSLADISERSLLAGELAYHTSGTYGGRGFTPRRFHGTRRLLVATVLTAAGLGLIGAALADAVDETGAFFAAGSLLLAASLCFASAMLRRRPGRALHGRGWPALSRLGLRSSTYRPGRSVLSMAVLASATFMLVSVDAFRRGDVTDASPRSGVGGYSLIVETLLPIAHDPNTEAGRQALNLFDLDGASIEPFRLLPGDDASCLNLYEPTSPRILAPRESFLAAGRFTFQSSLAATDAERENPWQLLHRAEADGAVPVIADANSMTYVLHRQLGEDIVISRGARQVRLRLVAALRDSIFQGELLMSQGNFLKLFPEEEGYRVLLVETAPERVTAAAEVFERALTDLGADATPTAERLAGFHKVENTYLSTFQALGGLGLLLGTVGLATVLLRNLLERRRELALLRAVGYARRHFLIMVLAENAVLLAGGLTAGAVCAAIAIAPGVAERGGRLPVTVGAALLLFAVFVTGLVVSVAATKAATRAPLLESLRSE
jgi:ABC-type lipoprotein release transport system permease subunit